MSKRSPLLKLLNKSLASIRPTLPLAVAALTLLVAFLGCPSNTSQKWDQRQGLKNRLVAALENGAERDKGGKLLKEAIDGFRKLTIELPTEKLGPQNLSVALLIALRKLDQVDAASEFQSLSKEFDSTIAVLKKISPEDPDADILFSRLHQLRGDRESAVDSLRLACRKPNATADTYYQLYELLQMEENPELLKEMQSLLKSAIKLMPNNLVLAVNALAIASEEDFKSELERCRELFRPLIARKESPIPKLLEGATTAAESKQWKVAKTQVAFLRNVLKAELAFQNDLHLLEPHDLEYVELEFSSKERETRGLTERSSGPKNFFEIRNDVSDLFSVAPSGVSAIATEDFDLDGHFDLLFATGKTIEVDSINRKSGSRKIASVTMDMDCKGIVLADLDRDFQYSKDTLPASALPTTNPPGTPPPTLSNFVDTDLDLIVFGEEGIRLFRNDLEPSTGARTLASVPLTDGLQDIRSVRTVKVIDFDHDSDLDIVISSSNGITLWSNRGDWTFADFTAYSNLPPTSQGIDSILAMDLDRNVLNDFLLGSEEMEHPILVSNNLHGRYHLSDRDWKKGLQGACRSLEAIDVNSDACWDIVSCGSKGTMLTTMKSPGHHGWVPSQVTPLSSKPMDGIVVTDVDNDGFSDCIAWGAEGLELFRGGEDGKLVLDKGKLNIAKGILQAVVFDLDRDGDEDLVCLNSSGGIQWLENKVGQLQQQLELVIRADEEGKQRPRERCNMHGVGSLVELKAGGHYQAKIVRGTRTKFGLGKESSADIMRVLWTNGIPNNVLGVNNRSTVFDQQNLGGSCPYLYAWNGERIEFCTDCLWAAPIGLQFAQGVSAPTREWEYLKLDGEQVKPRDGKYLLQVTEELWEAAYFDSIQLMAIDHPAEVEVYTNEKVGPPSLAPFRVHTVRNRRQPRSVLDQRGNDLTEVVAKRDQRFTKAWTEGYNQGLVEEHWLEVDLNDDSVEPKEEDQVTLFLTGWVFPTCTSLNLAMTENPLRPKLKPPSIQVRGRGGEWVEVIPYAGFPGGKTKTIAIDLSGKFLSNDRRVRIVTNMELSWDEVFWTCNDSQKESESYRLTKLELIGAELHYRGFSTLVPQPYNAPKRFDYGSASQESIWPPMTGNFTRYGDVKELIAEGDDLQVVMGAGDEMSVEFSSATSAIPEGWKRDFILYNIGWDKDADLNTVHGQSVEPLPFRGMSKYPYEPDESFPSDSKHVEFLKRFQTRNQLMDSFWNQIRDASL